MRTQKTAKNLMVGTILTTAIALLGLIKIKVFLNYLGDDSKIRLTPSVLE